MGNNQRRQIFLVNYAWMAGGKQLWNFISMYKPHILSAYVEESFDPNCIPGKTKWLKTNVQVYQQIELIW